MRIGSNPFNHHVTRIPARARITAAVVTSIPVAAGYFADRLDVLRLSLESLIRNADLPIDLMVFDNASCRQVRSVLLALCESGKIGRLILSSENVGLPGAYAFIADAAPGEFIAFANDDVLYFPHWLSPLVAIMDGMPDVGLVSGAYLRATHPRTAELAREKGLEVIERRAPDLWIEEFCRDASYPSPEAYYSRMERVGWTDLEDRVIRSPGAEAYAGGVCWQALFRKETLRKMLPRDDAHRPQGFKSYDGYFHADIVRQGYLRLSATQRVARHIGNVITPEVAALAASFGLDARSADRPRNRPRLLMKIPALRTMIIYAYNHLHRLVHATSV